MPANTKEPRAVEKAMAKIDSKLISAYTKFGFKLFAEIAKRDADAKVFLSPVSVAITLG